MKLSTCKSEIDNSGIPHKPGCDGEIHIEAMARFICSVPAKLIPYAKTHKCPIMANKKIEAWGIVITCSKLVEAEMTHD